VVGRVRTPLEGDGCAIDVPWRGVEVSLGLSRAEAEELQARADGVGLSVDETVTVVIVSILRSADPSDLRSDRQGTTG
jgi:hypothetical protein